MDTSGQSVHHRSSTISSGAAEGQEVSELSEDLPATPPPRLSYQEGIQVFDSSESFKPELRDIPFDFTFGTGHTRGQWYSVEKTVRASGYPDGFLIYPTGCVCLPNNFRVGNLCLPGAKHMHGPPNKHEINAFYNEFNKPTPEWMFNLIATFGSSVDPTFSATCPAGLTPMSAYQIVAQVREEAKRSVLPAAHIEQWWQIDAEETTFGYRNRMSDWVGSMCWYLSYSDFNKFLDTTDGKFYFPSCAMHGWPACKADEGWAIFITSDSRAGGRSLRIGMTPWENVFHVWTANKNPELMSYFSFVKKQVHFNLVPIHDDFHVASLAIELMSRSVLPHVI